MNWVARIVLALAVLGRPMAAIAQETDEPGLDLFAPGLVAPKENFGNEPGIDDSAEPVPYAPEVEAPPLALLPGGAHRLMLEARLAEAGAPLGDGIIWRVFSAMPGENGQLELFATARGGATTVQLPPGDYIVHAAFGRAGATKRVTITDDDQMESLILNAGGMKLDAIVGEDESVPADRLTFEILQQDQNGDLVTVVPDAAAGLVVRLSAGTYHVVSRYGDVNAVVRADIEVEPGKLTEAVMRHTGAEVTLKLVSAEGGEALANTSWTVLTQDGTTVHESIGAFPSIVLAEGSYSAVAIHQEQVYSRDFTIESGVDKDVEVRLADLVEPEPVRAPNDGNAPQSRGEPMEP